MDAAVFDWAFAREVLPALAGALGVTVTATLLGMAVALPLGLAWTLLRRVPGPVGRAAELWVDFLRSTPLLIQIYFLYYLLPDAGIALSPMTTGVVALGLHYGSYTSEVFRAGIEGVPRGQWEAARALRLGPWTTWRRVVLPQALPPVVPALGNYLISMLKDSPMLAAITVTELLQTAKILGAERFRYLEPLTLVGVFFLALSLVAAAGVRHLESRFRVRHA